MGPRSRSLRVRGHCGRRANDSNPCSARAHCGAKGTSQQNREGPEEAVSRHGRSFRCGGWQRQPYDERDGWEQCYCHRHERWNEWLRRDRERRDEWHDQRERGKWQQRSHRRQCSAPSAERHQYRCRLSDAGHWDGQYRHRFESGGGDATTEVGRESCYKRFNKTAGVSRYDIDWPANGKPAVRTADDVGNQRTPVRRSSPSLLPTDQRPMTMPASPDSIG